MLKLEEYNQYLLKARKLVGDKAMGMSPWEVIWIIEQVARVPGHVLEIGTHRGTTAEQICLAHPTRRVYAVDNWDRSYNLKMEEVGSEAKKYDNYFLTFDDSKRFIYPEGVGIVIIDGDHSWDGVKADTEKALEYFKNNKGLIIWHDYCEVFEVMPYLDYLEFNRRLGIKHLQFTTIAFLNVGT